MSRRKLFSPALLGLAALTLTACQDNPQRSVVVVPTQACNTDFRVVNNSSLTVGQLFFSHSSLGSWGADQLGSSVLPPGRFANYRAANAGNYDFRVVWTNGRRADLMGVNVCRASQITVTDRGLFAS